MTDFSSFLALAGIAGLIGLRLYFGISAARLFDSLPPELKARLRSNRYLMD